MSRKLGLAACVALAALILFGWLFIPKPDLYAAVPFSTLITDRDGQPLKLTHIENGRYRLFTRLDDVAPVARQATILYEDKRFFSHPGVDPIALARSAWTTYVERSRVVGGSTITMQLARLRFNMNTRSLSGKLRQILRAIQLERHYGKDEILEAYLNLAPYGGSVEGMGTASRVYFDKPASALSLGEALALAVVPQNPTARFPASASGRAELLSARARLLESWKTQIAPLNLEETARASLEPVVRPPSALPSLAPHFVRDSFAPDGQSLIRTSLDLHLQWLLEDRIEQHVARRRGDGLTNAAAMLIDHRNMQVLALVGSAGFFDAEIHGQVNGTRARRSPGSTLKPLLFGLAFDRGLIHPMTLLEDAPRRYSAYTPKNFDRGFLGPMLARDALIHSRNIPTVTLLAKLGVARFHSWLGEADIKGLRPAENYGLTLALGGAEVTMEELVKLYAMLANGGIRRELEVVAHPEPDLARFNGRAPSSGNGRRLLSGEASFLVLDILRDNPGPHSMRLSAGERRGLAWKTGTSFGFRDAWSVGVVGNYVLAVWVGDFDGSGNRAFVGREAAAPLFFSIADSLKSAHTEKLRWTAQAPGSWSSEQLNLERVEVCKATGDLGGRHCPRTEYSWFIPGVSPIKESRIYRHFGVDPETGLRSCEPGTRSIEAVFEFWPSDMRDLLRRAGIAIRRPPPWSPKCDLETTSAGGQPPRIRSPQPSLVYHAAKDDTDGSGIPFSAVVDADAQSIFWFVDDRFIARSAPGKEFLWDAQPGNFTVRAVDNLGRASSVAINVTRHPPILAMRADNSDSDS